MTRRVLAITVLLLVVFVGLLAYGIFIGDADYVLSNATSICFT
jgi:hypothetical protein